jgi:hypothetical protein
MLRRGPFFSVSRGVYSACFRTVNRKFGGILGNVDGPVRA